MVTTSFQASKVGVGIEKFQKEIEKAKDEKKKAMDARLKKASTNSRSASTDSLLSMDEGSDNSSNSAPILPPKGRFVSTDNLSPPALPPKQRPLSAGNLNKGMSVSSYNIAAHNSDTDCLTDGSVAERIKNFMSKATDQSLISKPMMKVRPRRSMQDLSTIDPKNNNADETKKEIGDLPKKLPSVRNLASIFSVPKKSPEPLPRRSLNKVSLLENSAKDSIKMYHLHYYPTNECHTLD